MEIEESLIAKYLKLQSEVILTGAWLYQTRTIVPARRFLWCLRKYERIVPEKIRKDEQLEDSRKWDVHKDMAQKILRGEY
jgi:hypothetical protein